MVEVAGQVAVRVGLGLEQFGPVLEGGDGVGAAGRGPAPENFDALFAPLQADPLGSLDGAQDIENMPLTDEPQQVRDDLRQLARSADRADDPRHRS